MRAFAGNLNDLYSASSAPVTLSGVQSLSAGYWHTCAIMQSGSLRCWGWNHFGQVQGRHSCVHARCLRVCVWCLQVGDGTYLDRSTPSVDVLFNVVAVSLGVEHTCALTATGSMSCWGSNHQGQIGVDDSGSGSGGGPQSEGGGSTTTHPAPVSDVMTGVSLITTGQYFSCGYKANEGGDHVVCFGQNNAGQLGLRDTADSTVNQYVPGAPVAFMPVDNLGSVPPFPIQSVRCGWVRTCGMFVVRRHVRVCMCVVCSQGHTCVLSVWGSVRCWGRNDVGQLGLGQ